MLGADTDAALLPAAAPSPSRGTPDEDATATINYTSGTTARPKGVQLTHRNLWINAATFGWHTGVTDRDVYLHTLPMFHCNGWGMPYALTGMGGTQIVLRKVDGAEILRRVERARRHAAVRRAGGRRRGARRRRRRGTARSPARGRTRMVVAGAPPPTRTIERIETELGWEFIQIYGLTETSPLLTINRRPGRVGRPVARRAGRASSAGPARRRSACALRVDDQGEVLARSQRRARGLLGPARGDRRRASSTAGSTPATAARSTTRATSPSPTARRT